MPLSRGKLTGRGHDCLFELMALRSSENWNSSLIKSLSMFPDALAGERCSAGCRPMCPCIVLASFQIADSISTEVVASNELRLL